MRASCKFGSATNSADGLLYEMLVEQENGPGVSSIPQKGDAAGQGADEVLLNVCPS
jgi:hypothetical protein